MTRKLVTLRQIVALDAIEGADQIELATVDGWQAIVKKGAFKVGDTGVYFECDAFIQASDDRFAFLAKTLRHHPVTGAAGYRIRTMKMRGQLSQGLLLPTADFTIEEITAGDLDAVLDVIPWEQPEHAQFGGRCAPGRAFPAFIPKTDQERIQNAPYLLRDNGLWEVSIKLDGSSMTIYHNHGTVGVCSRNRELDDDGNTFWNTAKASRIPELLQMLGLNLAIQGELMGPGIQGNREQLTEHQFYIYDIYDIDGRRKLTPAERMTILGMVPEFNLLHAPVMEDPICLRGATVPAILQQAEGPSLNEDVKREGLVYKRLDGRVSFKAIANSYLLNEA